jgi:hypothetical protein
MRFRPQVFQLFKTFVQTQRPAVDIESVATGETWWDMRMSKRV